MAALNQIFDPSRRDVKRLQKTADRILALEDAMAALSDSALRDKTALFRKRLKDGEPLDHLTAEAFAVVREAAYRAIGLKPFPVQLIGGLVLHEGNIAEMKTGEGKTLVAALPLLLLLSGIWSWLPLSLCLLALVVWKHRENIARLRAGTEKSWLKSKHKE